MGRAILSWSSGKDSAFALHLARRAGTEVVALLTTVTEGEGRVSIHGVRREVLAAQAEAVGLPLVEVALPAPCPNAVYEARMEGALAPLKAEGIETVVFGDIFLKDVRAYREARLAAVGMRGEFPLWGRETRGLAEAMLRAGIMARVATLDPARMPRGMIGARYDAGFLAALPGSVDPCGENGEFHTLVGDGPGFAHALPLEPGESVERDGFVYADFGLGDRPG
jgi:uncharacterized protein (TIGR00290 family)